MKITKKLIKVSALSVKYRLRAILSSLDSDDKISLESQLTKFGDNVNDFTDVVKAYKN